MLDALDIQNAIKSKKTSLKVIRRVELILYAICETDKIFHFATLKKISRELNKWGVKKYGSKYNENILRKLVNEKVVKRVGCSTCVSSNRKNCTLCDYTQYKRVEEARSTLKGNEASKSIFVPTEKGIAKNAEFTEELRILRNLIYINNYKRVINNILEKEVLSAERIDNVPNVVIWE